MVSHWACALDGGVGVVFGGSLRAYMENKGILEINAKRTYELDEEKRPHHVELRFNLLAKEL